MRASEIMEILGLRPLDVEGGHFLETYRTERRVEAHGGTRPLATAIYYLLTPDAFSAMHRLPSDEIYHFYAGDPVTMLLLEPGGRAERVVLGTDLPSGQRPQIVVEAGTWQGSCLAPGGRFALLGTTMSPGYDAVDLEVGMRRDLVRSHPSEAAMIERLTRA